MAMSGLNSTRQYAPEAHYRARERRAPPARPGPAGLGAPAAPELAGSPLVPASYASRFKTDLSLLQALDGAGDAAPAEGGEVQATLVDFLGALSALLVAVRAGDIARAQAAADALELDALTEREGSQNPGGLAPMLGDLIARLGVANTHSPDAARWAGQDLDVGLAYRALRHYLDGEDDAL